MCKNLLDLIDILNIVSNILDKKIMIVLLYNAIIENH